jgi:hypothetical protein
MVNIRTLVKRKRIAFKRHAAIRMRQRNTSAVEVEQALAAGAIIEDYSKSQPLPCYLILGYTKANRPLHVVAGVDSEDEMVWVITVYEPNIVEWEEGFTQRRTIT